MTTRTFTSTEIAPLRRGEELGRAHRKEVRACVDAYRRLFTEAAGEDIDLEALGVLALEQIALVSADLSAEVEGIADGAGLSVAEVAAINARTEILALLKRPQATPRGECSTVVHLGEPGHPLAVQAWDWYESLADLWFVWEIPHGDGRVTRTLTEYGIVGKIGLNDAGLAVLFNILHHTADGRTADGQRIGAPVHVLSRHLLDTCTDLNQALLLLTTAPVSASSSLTLVAATPGESAAVSVELNPARIGYALPDADGLLTHTNHFLTSPAAEGDTEPVTGPDSLLRLDLLRRRLGGRARLAAYDVLTAMDSHVLGGGGLCCHPDLTQPPASQYRTLATVVVDVAAGVLDVVAGGACTHPILISSDQRKENAMPALKRIDNMDILTRDVDRLVDFYHGVLGLPFHLPYEKEEEWAAIDLGNLTLYLFKSEVGEHAPKRTAVNLENAPGYDSMAFEVDDLDATESELDGQVEWVDERIEWKHPSGAWYRYRPFFDPDGNMVYITEPHRA
ncbi:putative acyltransferase [metagenome]|uniref:Putative acyltransferase n=1 Tax=metagenome TaxID=256318 RepID=A0A2P2C7P7_9ZZZZ